MTLDLSHNAIQSLAAFSKMGTYLPNLENLSLDSNHISDPKEFEHLKAVKLRELVVTNNPVCAQPNYESYVSCVELTRFCNGCWCIGWL